MIWLVLKITTPCLYFKTWLYESHPFIGRPLDSVTQVSYTRKNKLRCGSLQEMTCKISKFIKKISFLLRYNHMHNIQSFRRYSSGSFSLFTQVCNYHLCLTPEHFTRPGRVSTPISSLSRSPLLPGLGDHEPIVSLYWFVYCRYFI